MNLAVASVAVVAGILVWWLAVRRLTTRPWEAQGTYDGRDTADMVGDAPARIGLWVFLAVVTCLFALFVTAYFMRMSPHLAQGVVLNDWRPVDEPPILWLNTALLIASTIGMQLARTSARRGQDARARTGMLAGLLSIYGVVQAVAIFATAKGGEVSGVMIPLYAFVPFVFYVLFEVFQAAAALFRPRQE